MSSRGEGNRRQDDRRWTPSNYSESIYSRPSGFSPQPRTSDPPPMPQRTDRQVARIPDREYINASPSRASSHASFYARSRIPWAPSRPSSHASSHARARVPWAPSSATSRAPTHATSRAPSPTRSIFSDHTARPVSESGRAHTVYTSLHGPEASSNSRVESHRASSHFTRAISSHHRASSHGPEASSSSRSRSHRSSDRPHRRHSTSGHHRSSSLAPESPPSYRSHDRPRRHSTSGHQRSGSVLGNIMRYMLGVPRSLVSREGQQRITVEYRPGGNGALVARRRSKHHRKEKDVDDDSE